MSDRRAVHRLMLPALLCASLFSMGFRGCLENDGGARCEMASSCDACTAMSTCGWCGATSTCSTGSASGPSAGACAARWAWTADMCLATPGLDGGVRADASSPPGTDASSPPGTDASSPPGTDASSPGIDAGPPPGPCPGGCVLGTHCDAASSTCVADAGGCSYVDCPDTYTWTWTGSSPVTRAGCCRDYGSLTAGVGCGVDRYGIGTCEEAGGESPVDQPVVESPSIMRCSLATGAMDCPALYIGSGGGSSVYLEGCCAATSLTGATFCGVVGNCGSGPCCAPPTGSQTPVR